MDSSSLAAIWLTCKLATLTTVILLLVGTPIAWWLANTRSRLKGPVGALVALPLVLPPTVLGFYLLIAFGPQGFIGQAMDALNLQRLPFTFAGLVVASVIYSLPFVVQPIQNAFESNGRATLKNASKGEARRLAATSSGRLPMDSKAFWMGCTTKGSE
jgi:molybdate transport system permease protein